MNGRQLCCFYNVVKKIIHSLHLHQSSTVAQDWVTSIMSLWWRKCRECPRPSLSVTAPTLTSASTRWCATPPRNRRRSTCQRSGPNSSFLTLQTAWKKIKKTTTWHGFSSELSSRSFLFYSWWRESTLEPSPWVSPTPALMSCPWNSKQRRKVGHQHVWSWWWCHQCMNVCMIYCKSVWAKASAKCPKM